MKSQFFQKISAIFIIFIALLIWKISSINQKRTTLFNAKIESMLDLFASSNHSQKLSISNKVVIAGILRDNMNHIEMMIKNIEAIGAEFKDYRVILFENDSSDGTKSALKLWTKVNPNIKVISENYNIRKRPSHQFLAEARNHYLKELQDSKYKDFDIVIIMDMDSDYLIDINGIKNSFEKSEKWDAVCSNGISGKNNLMYDAFAFRNEDFPWTPDIWNKICQNNKEDKKWHNICEDGKKHSKGILHDLFSYRDNWEKPSRLYWLRIVPEIQKYYNPLENLISVDSCFGGMALYKKRFIGSCEYISNNNDSEHIAFHQCLKREHQARIMMNPAQIIKMDNLYKNDLYYNLIDKNIKILFDIF